MASALRYDHTPKVEKYKDIYVGWPDYAIKDGEIYSDRLPGTAFVLTGFLYYADFLKTLGLRQMYPDRDLNPIFAVFMSNLAGLATVLALFLFLFKYLGFSFRISLFSAIVFALCTLNYQESGRFFSHELSCCLVSLSTLIVIVKTSKSVNKSWLVFAFVLLSYSVLVELQNMLFFLPLFVFIYFQLREKKEVDFMKIAPWALPIVVFSALIIFLLPLYNYLTFGEWMLKSNTYNPNFVEEKSFLTSLSGDFFVGLEHLFVKSSSVGSWFGGESIGINGAPGLLVICPVFLISFYGWFLFYKKYKAISLLFLAVIILEVVIAAIHKTTLVRHIHTIHLFMFLPFVFTIDKIMSLEDKKRKFFLSVVILICVFSFLSVCKASHTFNYRTKIPIFIAFNLPFLGLYFLTRSKWKQLL